jgi:hypothetical protein
MGGLFYCDSCNLALDGSSKPIWITKNYAREGGVFYISDTSQSTISHTTFKDNRASKNGGLMSI